MRIIAVFALFALLLSTACAEWAVEVPQSMVIAPAKGSPATANGMNYGGHYGNYTVTAVGVKGGTRVSISGAGESFSALSMEIGWLSQNGILPEQKYLVCDSSLQECTGKISAYKVNAAVAPETAAPASAVAEIPSPIAQPPASSPDMVTRSAQQTPTGSGELPPTPPTAPASTPAASSPSPETVTGSGQATPPAPPAPETYAGSGQGTSPASNEQPSSSTPAGTAPSQTIAPTAAPSENGANNNILTVGKSAPSQTPAPKTSQSTELIGTTQVLQLLAAFLAVIIASYLVLQSRQEQIQQIDPHTERLLENETRAGIMQELSVADKIPTDLSLRLGKSKTSVVEHLAELVEAGLVQRLETPGRKFVYYSLTQKGRQVLLRRAA
ncbi:MAG: ArsR family transcriptional regulator [Candidatus Micrarchaeota archaeon]|nr:ArsR family transcriptional regulator [Candidatus Micrarchaeota archaeon]